MLFEELFESLVRRHRIPPQIAEDEGHVIQRRLNELLDLSEEKQHKESSTERRLDRDAE